MNAIPTLTTVRKLRDISAVLCESVAKGDADVAIEMLRDAEQCVDQALTDYQVTARLSTTPIDRRKLLELTGGALQRGTGYGEPSEHFTRTAELWSSLLGWPVKPTDVALCLVALKLARIVACPGHVDSWVDVAGYAACGVEVATAAPAEVP